MKKRWIGGSLLMLLVVISAAAYWLVMTSSGFQFALSLAQKTVPALTIEQASGKLSNGIEISQLAYVPESGPKVEIGTINGVWKLWSVLTGQLSVEQLHINDVQVTLDQTAVEPEDAVTPATDFEFALPLGLNVRSLRVTNVDLINVDGQTMRVLDRFDTSLRLNRDHLTLSSLSVSREDIAFTLVGDSRLSKPYPTNLNYGLKVNHQDLGLISVTGTVSGTTQKMVINQQLGEPFASQQTIRLFDLLDDLRWQASVESDEWLISQLVDGQRGNVEKISLQGEGNLQSASLQLETDITDLADALPPLNVSINVSSQDLQKWTVDSQFQLTDTTYTTLMGIVDLSGESPDLALTANWKNLQWPMQTAAQALLLEAVSGELNVTGEINDYQALLKTQATVMQEPLLVMATASGSLEQIAVNNLTVEHQAGQIQAEGEVSWVENLVYAMTMQWHDLTVPEKFIADRQVSSQAGSVRLNGRDQLIDVAVNAQLNVDDHPLTLSMSADSPQNGLADIQLTVDTQQGNASFDGQLGWMDLLSVDGNFVMQAFNPGQFIEQWPGALNAQAEIEFKQGENIERQLKINDLQVEGYVRDRDVALNADIALLNSQLNIPLLDFRSGDSTVTLQGQLQPTLLVDWQINSPDLADLYPDLAGRLTADGRATGALDAVKIKAKLLAQSVAFQDQLDVEKIEAVIDFDLSEQAINNVTLRLDTINVNEQQIDSVRFTLSGQREQHQATLDVDAELLALSMAIEGELDKTMRWQGQITQMQFSNELSGAWQLEQAGALQLSAERQSMAEHCWQSAAAQFCLQGDHQQQQGWQTQGTLESLPLALFETFYNEFAQLDGTVNARFNLMAEGETSPVGNGEVSIENGRVEMTGEVFEKQDPIDITTLAVRYQLSKTETALALDLTPNIEGVSPLIVRLQTAPLYDFLAAPEQTAVSVQLQTAIEDLSLLNISHEAVNDLAGQFNADIDIAGTLKRPQINSVLTLRDVQVRLNALGILIEELNADVKGDPQTGVDFMLQGRSGDGRFEADGAFLLPESGWTFNSTIKGDDVQVMNLPEALVTASPDLTVALTAQSANLTGRIVIPTAELAPLEFNQAVSPSKDVVIINQPVETTGTMMQTDLDIQVVLGDNVRLRAAGFEGRLGGELRVYGDAGKLLMANGEITLVEGAYAAYGRKLTVDGGKIRFSGGAIDNPDLDIRAVRTGSDWRAGIHITGPANNPLATLFSVPPMTQDNILSYILLGRPIGQASAGDGAMLASAATSLGIANGNALGADIASTFGLDSVAFTGDSPETAAVQIGKYLSPKLYIGYGVGILDAVNTVQLRYELSKIWTLQAESGTESGVDLLYIFER